MTHKHSWDTLHWSAPGSPQNSPPNIPVPQNSPTVSSNTPASIPNAQTETEGIDDVETIDLIDTDDDKMEAVEEEEEEAEEAEKEDEAEEEEEDVEINVDMFRFVTDAVVEALHKACHKDEKISSLLNSFKIALDNERGLYLLLIDKYEQTPPYRHWRHADWQAKVHE